MNTFMLKFIISSWSIYCLTIVMTYHITGTEGSDRITGVVHDSDEDIGGREGCHLVFGAVVAVNQISQQTG